MRVSVLTDHKQINALVALAQDWENRGGWLCPDAEGYVGAVEEREYTPTQGNQQTYELLTWLGAQQGGLLSISITEYGCGIVNRMPIKMIAVEASTPALAICKAVIASKWGDTIPDEIMEKAR